MTPYPLAWPEGMKRTPSKVASRLKTSLAGAMKNVRDELIMFGNDTGKRVENVVISSNVTLGVDSPSDPGVAVWFTWDGATVCIAVDRYQKVQDNLQAIYRVLEARRTEMRHGGIEITRATMRGFTALPAPAGKRTWRNVLGFSSGATPSRMDIQEQYRSFAKHRHPDKTGSDEAMAELNRARDEALAEIGA